MPDGLFNTRRDSSSNRTSNGIASPFIERGSGFGTSMVILITGFDLVARFHHLIVDANATQLDQTLQR